MKQLQKIDLDNYQKPFSAIQGKLNELVDAVAELQGEKELVRAWCNCEQFMIHGVCEHGKQVAVSAPIVEEAIPNDAVYKQGVAFGRDAERRRIREGAEHCQAWATLVKYITTLLMEGEGIEI